MHNMHIASSIARFCLADEQYFMAHLRFTRVFVCLACRNTVLYLDACMTGKWLNTYHLFLYIDIRGVRKIEILVGFVFKNWTQTTWTVQKCAKNLI